MGTVHSGHRTSAADADRQGKSDTRFVEDMESWFPFFGHTMTTTYCVVSKERFPSLTLLSVFLFNHSKGSLLMTLPIPDKLRWKQTGVPQKEFSLKMVLFVDSMLICKKVTSSFTCLWCRRLNLPLLFFSCSTAFWTLVVLRFQGAGAARATRFWPMLTSTSARRHARSNAFHHHHGKHIRPTACAQQCFSARTW